MRAVKNGTLQAVRANDGWRIAPDDLAAWQENRGASLHVQSVAPAQGVAHMNEQGQRLEMLRETIGTLGAALAAAERSRDQAETDRDHWRAMAERLAERPGRWRWPWS